MAIRPGKDGSLFMHSDGSPLRTDQFVTALRWRLTRLVLPGQEFGSHSFRIRVASAVTQIELRTGQLCNLALAFGSIQYVCETPSGEPVLILCFCSRYRQVGQADGGDLQAQYCLLGT